jgi:hypothetical protein
MVIKVLVFIRTKAAVFSFNLTFFRFPTILFRPPELAIHNLQHQRFGKPATLWTAVA